MKIPQTPPSMDSLLQGLSDPSQMARILPIVHSVQSPPAYVHWDKLRRLPAPEGITHQEWWLALKIFRLGRSKAVALTDKEGNPFQFSVPEMILKELHEIDLGAGGTISLPDQITNPHTRDRYLVRSLIEEAITSSQLEGAITTREVAKELIRTGRAPRDTSEQMILNNYETMLRIGQLKTQALSPQLVFEIHRMITENTLDDPTAAGRFRTASEVRVVGDDTGQIYHQPPEADELPRRMEEMCDFANGKTPDYFVHPAVRAMILHFWLAYDHPFVDGNGRTARALFYWAMLHSNYWLFEFISISNILRKAPAKYGRSFLHTETDDNDLTYFIDAQSRVIRQAITELHRYIERKTAEISEIESHMRALDLFNHRQVDLIRHALKHPGHRYTIESHQTSQKVAYQTARTDLLDLGQRGVLDRRPQGKQILFIAPADLPNRLLNIDKEASQTGKAGPAK